MQPEYSGWLGITSPQEEGQYLVGWHRHQKVHQNADRAEAEVEKLPESLAPMATKALDGQGIPRARGMVAQKREAAGADGRSQQAVTVFQPVSADEDRRLVEWVSIGNAAKRAKCAARLQWPKHLSAGLPFELPRETSIPPGKICSLAIVRRLAGGILSRQSTSNRTGVRGMAIEHLANQTDLVFLDRAQLSTKQILLCLDTLKRLPPMPTVAEKIDLGERIFILDTIQIRQLITDLNRLNDRGLPTRGARIKAGPHPSLGGSLGRSIGIPLSEMPISFAIIRSPLSRKTNREARLREMAAFEQELATLKSQATAGGFIQNTLMGPQRRGETIGNILIELFLSPFGRVQNSRDQCNQERDNLHVAFALAAYQRERGRYPISLGELAPQFLDKIPGDLFSGKPLIYRQVAPWGCRALQRRHRWERRLRARGYDDKPPGDDLCIHMPQFQR